jgi:Putative, 10TM heavy-metal exporter
MDLLRDAVADTAKLAPFLYAIYLAIEILEYRWGKNVKEYVWMAGSSGPLIGAVLGAIPQCGFSVIVAALYTQGLVTIGTLLAVMISTSDEAIPVILSHRDKIGTILPLIATKICLGLVVGYTLDLIYRRRNKAVRLHAADLGSCSHDHNILEEGCCGHRVGNGRNTKDLILHPLLHAAKISAFIFIITFVAAYAFSHIRSNQTTGLFLKHSILQPVMTALIGMIPNCAASVAIAEMYLRGAISYGSTISGLASGCGLSSLVLLRENKDLSDTLAILGYLVFSSVMAGIAIQSLFG